MCTEQQQDHSTVIEAIMMIRIARCWSKSEVNVEALIIRIGFWGPLY